MSIAARLKEERQRLGLSQTAFGALAGVTKSAQIKWESGASSAPTAPALAAFAEAGADVVYILTGKRERAKPETVAASIDEQLNEMERLLIDPSSRRSPDETEEEADERVVTSETNRLRSLLHYDTQLMTPELIERAENLLDIASDPLRLSTLRAADFVQKRRRRERIQSDIEEYMWSAPYTPSPTVMKLLATMALDYSVPVKMLAELIWDVSTEITGEPKYSDGNSDDEAAKGT